jgi:hypothetical protein
MSRRPSLITEAIDYAEALGWSCRETQTHNGSCKYFLHAPHHNIVVVLDTASPPRETLAVSISRKIFKYADPIKRASWVATSQDPEFIQLVAPALEVARPVEPPPAKPKKESVVRPEKQLLSSQPWLAKRRLNPSESKIGGLRYPSHAVIERRWSDGTVDYKCSWCLYTNDNPRSVATHYGQTKSHPAAGQSAKLIRDPEYTEVSAKRHSHWASKIKLALDELNIDLANTSYEELAHKLAEKLFHKHIDDAELSDATPPTAEDLLEKIRHIVDRGQYIEMQRNNEALREQLAKMESEMIASRDAAKAAEERWDALKSLIEGN